MTHWPLLLLAILPALSAQPDRFSLPACSGADQELADRSFFLLCHSSSRKVPLWTGYELKPEHLEGGAPRPKRFRRDAELFSAGATNADYRGSGFSRGHLVPARDLAWSESSIAATFLLSNSVPQHPGVNSGRWRQLEAAVRRIAADSDAVYVFSGPLFDSDIAFIGRGQVAVPSRLFKVILALEGDRKTMYAAIVPNAPTVAEPLDHFVVSVEEVQNRTGLDFFSALEDGEERRLESVRQPLPIRDAGCATSKWSQHIALPSRDRKGAAAASHTDSATKTSMGSPCSSTTYRIASCTS